MLWVFTGKTHLQMKSSVYEHTKSKNMDIWVVRAMNKVFKKIRELVKKLHSL